MRGFRGAAGDVLSFDGGTFPHGALPSVGTFGAVRLDRYRIQRVGGDVVR